MTFSLAGSTTYELLVELFFGSIGGVLFLISINCCTMLCGVLVIRAVRAWHRRRFGPMLSMSYTESEVVNDDCPVCLEEFLEGESLARLPCLHGYVCFLPFPFFRFALYLLRCLSPFFSFPSVAQHRECIGKWLEANPSCPLCKREYGSF
mmetsp:Transcript_3788/g.9875  ORF Transcript_3788/g.9875 Transcript_3788/m.9875 type:complete len:150 (+) Transcript_3788:313-762(+)